MARRGLKIQMGPYTLRQKWVSEKSLAKKDAWATYNPVTREISLGDACDVERAHETLMHELVEAANAIGDLSLPHSKIQTLGILLSQALRPVLQKWW